GLAELANGDMAGRIQTPFSSQYDSLRNDFNHAVEKLQAALALGIVAHAVGLAGKTQILDRRLLEDQDGLGHAADFIAALDS
ncbi:hypothetical protein AB9F39_37845, partial [Rhizobium leguminosarum]